MPSDPNVAAHQLAELLPALRADLDDPEVSRARASILAKLLGTTAAPHRIGRYVVLERIGAGGMGVVYSAYDPQLDRKIAIKLLFAHRATADARNRLADEAKTMAKLAHPNVVHVYEFGEHGGQLFVAMELVRGRTLRQWCGDASRTVRDTMAVCVQAGEGLAAAHAAGIVHRDFKPDNVLVGEDGRARVLDFGLARALEEPTESDAAPLTASSDGPQQTESTRARMGTPGYVAPEQLRGEASDRLSDQFSFCITVWEALTGARPFVGHVGMDLLLAIERGAIAAPPRNRVPAWIERVLRRGLADAKDPSRGRWPSVAELLQALDQDPAKIRRRRIGIGAVVVGIVGAFALGASSRSPAAIDPCSSADALIESAWPSADREAALARIVEIGGAYGAAIAPRLRKDADEYAQRWSAGYRDACGAHQRGEQSAELLDRRMACLQRDKRAFVTLARVTSEADRAALAGLVSATEALPDLAACDDLEALRASQEPIAPELRPLVERLAEIETLHNAGDVDAAEFAATGLVEDARGAGSPWLLAQALFRRGYQLLQGRKTEEAAPLLMEATTTALAAGDDEVAIQAWALGAWAMAIAHPAKRKVEFQGEALMTAIAERGAPSRASAFFYQSLGGIEIARGNREQARAQIRRALDIQARRGVPAEASALESLALATDDPRERSELLSRANDAWVESLGPEHPRTLDARVFRATNLEDAPTALSELRAICRDYESFHPTGLHDMRECWKQVLVLSDVVGDANGSAEAAEKWAHIAEDDEAIEASARLALARGRPADAASSLVELVDRLRAERPVDAPFWVDLPLGDAEIALGLAWRALDDPRADEMLASAVRRLENATGTDTRPVLLRRAERARKALRSAR